MMKRSVLAVVLATLATTSALAVPVEKAPGIEVSDVKGRKLVSHVYRGGPGTTYGQRNHNSWIGFLAGFALLFIAPFFLVMTELQGVMRRPRATPCGWITKVWRRGGGLCFRSIEKR